jgi:hypothetical protein
LPTSCAASGRKARQEAAANHRVAPAGPIVLEPADPIVRVPKAPPAGDRADLDRERAAIANLEAPAAAGRDLADGVVVVAAADVVVAAALDAVGAAAGVDAGVHGDRPCDPVSAATRPDR